MLVLQVWEDELPAGRKGADPPSLSRGSAAGVKRPRPSAAPPNHGQMRGWSGRAQDPLEGEGGFPGEGGEPVPPRAAGGLFVPWPL